MRRIQEIARSHRTAWFGLWVVVLIGVVAIANWQFAGGGSAFTAVLGAQTSKPDTTPPSVSISFPAKNGVYGADTWIGCTPTGICGTASDTSGVSAVQVTIQQGKGNYWDSSTKSFSSTAVRYNVASGTATWTLPFPVPPDGSYTVSVQATDTAGNTSKATSVAFQVDSTAVSNKPFGISGSFTGSFAPGVQQRLDLVLTDPYSFPITVTGVNVKVEAGTSKAGCDGPTNLTVVSQAGVTSLNPVTVQPGPAGYALSGNQRPLLEMPNLSTSQDACKGAQFTLSYTGTATK
jgi:hypothetical protein